VPVPLIAVPAYHLPAGSLPRWRTGAHALPEEYAATLARAGAQALLLPAPAVGDPAALLDRCDGLLLAGGGDVDPARYGQAPSPHLERLDPRRDELELALLRAAERRGLPVLAVCRGLQLLNVAAGGTLHQHLPEVAGMGPHREAPGGDVLLNDLRVAGGGRLAAALATPGGEAPTRVRGACSHHQGIDRLGDGLTAVAWSADGLVEGVEREHGWVVGVQWHPEQTAAADPAQAALFSRFTTAARTAAARAAGRGGGAGRRRRSA
jgi:putative glutamine amidotransferase